MSCYLTVPLVRLSCGKSGSGVEQDDGDGEVEDVHIGEARKPVAAPNPRTPTRAEREEHELTAHSVYRSWCSACVKGRGVYQHHKTTDRDASIAVPRIHVDYCFIHADGNAVLTLTVTLPTSCLHAVHTETTR